MEYEKVNIDTYLFSSSHIERWIVRGIALQIVLLSLVLLIQEFLMIKAVWDSVEGSGWGVIIKYTIFYRRVRIAVASIAVVVLVWPYRAKRLLLSTFALAYIAGEYIYWRIRSSIGLRNAEIDYLPEPNILGLYGATWLDIVVLSLTIILLVWGALRLTFTNKSKDGLLKL